MPRSNNSGGSRNRSGNANTLLIVVVALAALVVALNANKGSAPQPQAVQPATGVPAGLDQDNFASDARLARMTSEAERATGAAQNATASGQSGYSDGLMRRAEHAQDQLQMAKIENQLEESKDQLTELAAKYPDNEKVAYALDAITIAEDAAEVCAPSAVFTCASRSLRICMLIKLLWGFVSSLWSVPRSLGFFCFDLPCSLHATIL